MAATKKQLKHADYTVAIICPLEVEMSAVRYMLDDEHARLLSQEGDMNRYIFGEMSGHNVVIGFLPYGSQGAGSAATVATDMRRTFPAIQLRLLVGIGGGVPSYATDLRLGDVVVGMPSGTHGGVVQYDLGKETMTGFDRKGFLEPPPKSWRGAIVEMQADHRVRGNRISKFLSDMIQRYPRLEAYRRLAPERDTLFAADNLHALGEKTCEKCDKERVVRRTTRYTHSPAIFYGLIASGNRVMKNAKMRDKISYDEGGVLCFEMEAAGLVDDFHCVVIRGIADYADSHKNDDWHPYAAAVAAGCAKELLTYMVPIVDKTQPKHEASSTVPFSPDPDFVDRDDILAWIYESCSKPAARAALVGLSGVGKSQLAIQYSHYLRKISPHTWVFWVHASNSARFEEAYRIIADRLMLPGRDDPNLNVLQLVYNWLCDEANGQWLLILDNADETDAFFRQLRKRQAASSYTATSTESPLAAFLPQSSNGSILITSRNKDAAVKLVGGSKMIKEVGPMNQNQGLQLLRNKLEGSPEEDKALELLYALGYVPLAITQAAAYINRGAPRMSISRYLADFNASDKKKTNLLNRDAGDIRRDPSVSNSVSITWQMSFERIYEERRSAADLLSLMSFFNPQGIPEDLLQDYAAPNAKEDKEVDVDSDFVEDLDTLRAYSLVMVIGASGTYGIHPLVQFTTRVWLKSSGILGKWRNKFLRIMSKKFPTGDFENWPTCQMLHPHIEYIATQEPPDNESLKDWAQILTNAAWYMWMKGSYGPAEDMAVKALGARERILGSGDLETLASMSILASVMQYRGKYEDAEEMHRRVLEGREKALGKKDRDTLKSVSDVASALWYRGKYEESRIMNQRALEGREEALGKEHPDTLESVANLASVLRSQGKYEAAEEMSRRALAGYQKVQGVEHPATLTSMANLALMLRDQGRWKEAEDLHLQVIETSKRVLGNDHPLTLTSVANLASTYRNQGRWKEAEELQEQVMKARKRVLGEKHPDTLSIMGNLGATYRNQGRWEQAENLHLKVMKTRVCVLGMEHPDTLSSMGNLGATYQHQGRWKEAGKLEEEVMKTSERVLGKEHPDTLSSMANLAWTYRNQSRWKDAEELQVEVVEVRKRVLGEEHPSTLTSMASLAETYQHQGREKEFRGLEEQVMKTSKKVLGKELASTLTRIRNLAWTLKHWT